MPASCGPTSASTTGLAATLATKGLDMHAARQTGYEAANVAAPQRDAPHVLPASSPGAAPRGAADQQIQRVGDPA
eukprot:551063-Prorocentrum_lima.AAC.1